jgi:lysophospholipase L1-like esterase
MNKKILLLTDSLSLPRFKPEVCKYVDTYPEHLKQKGYIVHQVSIGGATSGDILMQVNYHKAFEPDYVFVQVGIVDCAPRFFTRLELELYRKLKKVGVVLMKIRKKRRKVYTYHDGFRANISQIQKSYSEIPVYFIGILPATESYEKLLPGITQNIKSYNNILSQTQHYISNDDFDSSGIMSDGHHLNAKGHQLLFEKIVRVLEE